MPVSSVMRPVPTTASRALTTRFMITCSRLPTSTLTLSGVGDSDSLDLQVLADQAADHRRHALQDLVDVDDLGLQRSSCARTPAVAASAWRRAAPPPWRPSRYSIAGEPLGCVHQRELDESHHRRQQVVEVVRDAAGQPADALDLLRLAQLLLQARLDLFGLLSPGDVGGAQRGGDDLTALDDRPRPHRPPCARIVRTGRAEDLVFVELARREHLLDRRRRRAPAPRAGRSRRRDDPITSSGCCPGAVRLMKLIVPARSTAMMTSGTVSRIDRSCASE